MSYQHKDINGRLLSCSPGKVVCVGRNYRAHAEELGNAVPKRPVLFMKPGSALQPMSQPIQWPSRLGNCHHELELAVLIGKEMSAVLPEQALDGIWGYSLGLDLTLREQQNKLKLNAQPWERAKAFAGSCPMGSFIPAAEITDPQGLQLELQINGEVRQAGETGSMLFSVAYLLAEIAELFTLQPGDVVMTGTPVGVGPLKRRDQLMLQLQSNSRQWQWRTRVAD